MELLPVCWIVREGDNTELRYSMRSIAANLEHKSAAIAGHKPDWVSGAVEHITTRQRRGAKQHNIRTNVRAACRHWDRWILCWDDVYLMQSFDELPIMNVGTITERVGELFELHGKETSFARSIRHAGTLLESWGYDEPLCFDSIHVPQIIDSETMLRACDLAERHGTSRILTLHGNLAGYTGQRVVNAKSRDDGWRERPILSTNDNVFASTAIGQHVRNTFTEPCDYETGSHHMSESRYPDLVTSLTSREACEALFDMAAKVPKTQAVVEVGVYKGRTTVWLAAGAQSGKGAHVVGVDPWDLDTGKQRKAKFARSATYDFAVDYIHQSGYGDGITLCRGTSADVATTWDGPKIGLLYVDGDHERDAVIGDFYAWRPHLSGNAVIVWDDYHTPRTPGVREAVDHLHAEGYVSAPQPVGDVAVATRLARRTSGTKDAESS